VPLRNEFVVQVGAVLHAVMGLKCGIATRRFAPTGKAPCWSDDTRRDGFEFWDRGREAAPARNPMAGATDSVAMVSRYRCDHAPGVSP
jgi:hypothetical protein